MKPLKFGDKIRVFDTPYVFLCEDSAGYIVGDDSGRALRVGRLSEHWGQVKKGWKKP